ncbi:MAG: hypothetical protein Q8P60_09875 [Pseudorhodobacter sp.]|nr:hypothetical protein [Pseudorhodobacter sp.]
MALAKDKRNWPVFRAAISRRLPVISPLIRPQETRLTLRLRGGAPHLRPGDTASGPAMFSPADVRYIWRYWPGSARWRWR